MALNVKLPERHGLRVQGGTQAEDGDPKENGERN
jgi:hypothetical protein